MKSIKLALLLVLVVALAALALQNQAPWRVRFFWLTGEVPGSILLFLTAAAGLIVGITWRDLIFQADFLMGIVGTRTWSARSSGADRWADQ